MTTSSDVTRRLSLRPDAAQVSSYDLHVALLEPEIHWNTGNAGRTCLAAGAMLHLIEPLGFSLAERQVRRSGLDYWPRVPLAVWPTWADFEAALPPGHDLWLFSAEGIRPHWGVGYRRPAVLVFGRESEGLPAALRSARSERLLGIPMADPELRSLNLSTAIGIALYEVRRQWAALTPGGSGS